MGCHSSSWRCKRCAVSSGSTEIYRKSFYAIGVVKENSHKHFLSPQPIFISSYYLLLAIIPDFFRIVGVNNWSLWLSFDRPNDATLDWPCTHSAAMSVLARLSGGGGSDQRFAALGSAATRLLKAFTMQVEVQRRLRHGTERYVRVEHVLIGDGGQAVIGNVKTRDCDAEGSSSQ
jgi:hypothetical protein